VLLRLAAVCALALPLALAPTAAVADGAAGSFPAGAPFPAAAPWVAPLAPLRVTRPFDAPASPYGPGHRGVDLAAAPGAVVVAAGAGVVAFAGMVAGRPVVSVAHPGGLRTTYEPVAPSLRAGLPVARGSPIGTLVAGHAGCPVTACLHWGARRGSGYLDPLLLLRPPRVRLLPWG
jgi:murein DD-endopeptidase MepM/ murein hydrolase activator NlpD